LSRDKQPAPKGGRQVAKFGTAKPASSAQGGSLGAALLDAMQRKGQPR
jgi:hypothetical protein